LEDHDNDWTAVHIISIAAITVALFPLLFLGGSAWTLLATGVGASSSSIRGAIQTGLPLWRNEL
tara:strand:- start:6229 stop:6420 length:192 start_codon:yes stop_codon:yes gene_type:complete